MHLSASSLVINDHIVRTPVALASMAGIVDAAYVLERKDHIGVAFIGGYSIDQPTMDAAKKIAACGDRREFMYDDPAGELTKQIEMLKGTDLVVGINLRGSTPEAFSALAETIGDSVVYEIDAHCRQAPMIEAGTGEYYLKNPRGLIAAIKALKNLGVTVSVKMRVGVADDDRALVRALWQAGADILHIDLMDTGIAKLRQNREHLPADNYRE